MVIGCFEDRDSRFLRPCIEATPTVMPISNSVFGSRTPDLNRRHLQLFVSLGGERNVPGGLPQKAAGSVARFIGCFPCQP